MTSNHGSDIAILPNGAAGEPAAVATRVPQHVKRHRLSETVADAIVEDLLLHQRQPGDQLPTEPELVKQYGVSRTVVREAGRLLAERGLVDISPGRGMVVADFDGTSVVRQFDLMLQFKRGSFQQLLEMRLVLEVGMTEYAALRHTEEDIEAIRASITAFADAGNDHEAALAADLDFHTAVARASRNPFFIHIITPVNDYLQSAYQTSQGYEGHKTETLKEHTAIADAIEASDVAEAARLAKSHLDRVLEVRNELVEGADGVGEE